MPKYYIRRYDGKTYSLFGWKDDVFDGLHYDTEADAYAVAHELVKDVTLSVEKVPPKLAPGETRLEKAIFSGGFHGPNKHGV